MDAAQLVALAVAARERAYAPYSRFAVGAVVLTDDGRTFTGCNVENASYGLTVCAERVAVFSAVAAGARRVVATAVVSAAGASMCGACRQVVSEFAAPDAPVHLAKADGSFRTRTVAELLPEAFGPGRLAEGREG
ncbi:MAG: cytidine deaminase [Planctomycetes bacterium]|nr:cytidine deaminase [Planctomycetota bacterium]